MDSLRSVRCAALLALDPSDSVDAIGDSCGHVGAVCCHIHILMRAVYHILGKDQRIPGDGVAKDSAPCHGCEIDRIFGFSFSLLPFRVPSVFGGSRNVGRVLWRKSIEAIADVISAVGIGNDEGLACSGFSPSLRVQQPHPHKAEVIDQVGGRTRVSVQVVPQQVIEEEVSVGKCFQGVEVTEVDDDMFDYIEADSKGVALHERVVLGHGPQFALLSHFQRTVKGVGRKLTTDALVRNRFERG